jgi:hypothetical protein
LQRSCWLEFVLSFTIYIFDKPSWYQHLWGLCFGLVFQAFVSLLC